MDTNKKHDQQSENPQPASHTFKITEAPRVLNPGSSTGTDSRVVYTGHDFDSARSEYIRLTGMNPDPTNQGYVFTRDGHILAAQ